MTGDVSEPLTWKVEVVERPKEGEARWRHSGTLQGGLLVAQESARQLRTRFGAARLTAPGFEVLALRDSFSVKRTGCAA